MSERVRSGCIDVKSDLLGDVNNRSESALQGRGVMTQDRPTTCMRNESLRDEIIGEEHIFLDQTVGIFDGVGLTKLGQSPIAGEFECKFDGI